MIVSTSSYNVPMSDELHRFVEEVVRAEFRLILNAVRSVDARLEAIRIDHETTAVKAMIRVDLNEGQRFDIERLDDDLKVAVRQTAMASASSVRRYINRSVVLNASPPQELRVSLGSYSTASI